MILPNFLVKYFLDKCNNFIALIFFVIFLLFLQTCFNVLIKYFNQKCFDENIFITYAGYCFYAEDYMHMLST